MFLNLGRKVTSLPLLQVSANFSKASKAECEVISGFSIQPIRMIEDVNLGLHFVNSLKSQVLRKISSVQKVMLPLWTGDLLYFEHLRFCMLELLVHSGKSKSFFILRIFLAKFFQQRPKTLKKIRDFLL